MVRLKPRPGLVGGNRPKGNPPRKPHDVHALSGATLVVTPAPPTRKRGAPAQGIGAGGAYRMTLIGDSPINGGKAYVYKAGPYTVAAPYLVTPDGTRPAHYGPYGPGLVVYLPNGGTLPASRYYLRGL